MTHAFLCVGMKGGDVLGCLPILRHHWSESGQKQNVIVAKAYLPIVSRASYCNPVEWPGHWGDLRGAMKFAKRSFDRVTCLATYGDAFPMQKRLPGFQLDQWERSGMLRWWDMLSHEIKSQPQGFDVKPPFILVADYSESSAFPQIEDLVTELTAHFPAHKILRLSAFRLENPCDLVPLMDQADALVSIETMALHLSKYSKVPAIALVTDKPSRWHGSSWSKKFRLHVRYSDYENRKADIVHAVRDAVNKVEPIKVEPIPYAPRLAYNPSILRPVIKLWTTWRIHPDPKSWRTELQLHDGENFWPVTVPGFEQYSLEDGRLFMFQGKAHLSLTISRSPLPGQSFSPCVCGYGELKRTDSGFVIPQVIRPQFGTNSSFSGTVKNLLFFEHSGKMFCIWECSPEQVVLELEGGLVSKVFKTPCPPCSFGVPRGGTQPLPYKGKWLRFFHACQRNEKSDQWWSYHVGALIQESRPPFEIIQLSKRPILTGTEQYFHGHSHWKPRVVITHGAVEEGDGWRLALGVNDSQCAAALITEKELNL